MGTIIQNVEDRQVFQLLSLEAKLRGVSFRSCLDVGCGMNPVEGWFRSYVGLTDAPYYAIDVRPEVKEALKLRNIKVWHPDEVSNDFSVDLVIAQEVIEHILPNDIPEFCSSLRGWTQKALALTCPNFVGFDPTRHCAIEPELRFVPDHLKNFNSQSSDPNIHKTATTAELIQDVLTRTFPDPDWSVNVYRAWPWLLADIPAKKSFFIYFKVFAIVWRN